MGKVVKAIAVVAIAAGVSFIAPYLLPAFNSLVATAVLGAVVSIAANAAMQAITASPADAPSGYRRGSFRFDPVTFERVEEAPPPPLAETLPPISPRSWRWAFFWPWQSAAVARMAGDCMDGLVPAGTRWIVARRDAPLVPGALFVFDLDDLWSAYSPVMRWRWWQRLVSVGMVKRYLGTDPEWGRLVFDCTNPPSLCETGFNHVRFAYGITSHHRTWWSAWRASRG